MELASKKSGSVILPMRNSMRRAGTLSGEREEVRVLRDGFVCQSDDLVNLIAREVGRGAEIRIAYYIYVGEACQAERLAEPAAARALEIENQIRVVADGACGTDCSVERAHQRCLVLGGVCGSCLHPHMSSGRAAGPGR